MKQQHVPTVVVVFDQNLQRRRRPALDALHSRQSKWEHFFDIPTNNLLEKRNCPVDWVLVIELLIRQGVENDEDLMDLIVDEFLSLIAQFEIRMTQCFRMVLLTPLSINGSTKPSVL